ncbi:hypothetical protein [Methylobacterium planeticum]|uniref:Uncharacterized protein n=1 Tax=Methylobacterium planeticum TaxID=2615211 RepID=A0A6N6MJ18_9HYPH|nr:hypothetical protein [Methylobacterium planeticum]KAB1068813.1 hypothetical protein F6X51_26220 [Methylobacterium planeticum]
MVTFDQAAVEAIGGKWEEARLIGQACEELAAGRVPVVEARGLLAQSKLAWKASVLEQILRYRLVALTEGTIQEWNSKNILASMVLARTISETSAAILEIHRKALKHLKDKDFRGLNALVEAATFATREKDWVEEFPQHKTKSIMTAIQKLDREVPGFEREYDMLSEISHPNSMGHFSFFATLDHGLRRAEFSTQKRNVAPVLSSILVSCMTILLASKALEELVDALPAIAELRPPALGASI